MTWRCLLLLVILPVLLSSCRSVSHIQDVGRLSSDSVRSVAVRTDSVILHDSTYHYVYKNADTVVELRYVERTRYRDRLVHDTVIVQSLDTLRITDTRTVYKESGPSVWQVLPALLLLVAVVMARYVKK